jgi:hypothetical protein
VEVSFSFHQLYSCRKNPCYLINRVNVDEAEKRKFLLLGTGLGHRVLSFSTLNIQYSPCLAYKFCLAMRTKVVTFVTDYKDTAHFYTEFL